MKGTLLFVLASLLLSGCASQRIRTMDLFTLPSDCPAQRQIERRIYNTDDVSLMLDSAIGVLQDMGYTIRESNRKSGVLTGTAIRPAKGAIPNASTPVTVSFLSVFGGSQSIEVMIVIHTCKDQLQVRATFARQIFLKNGSSYLERITDSDIYREFYERLDQSVFLTANMI